MSLFSRPTSKPFGLHRACAGVHGVLATRRWRRRHHAGRSLQARQSENMKQMV